MEAYDIRITRFNIKHFRNFESFEIKFDDEDSYTALVGRNGIGKTSILEALNICLSDNSSRFNNVRESDFCSDKSIEFEVEFNKPFFLSYQESSQFSRLLPCKKFLKIISRRDRKAPDQFISSPYNIKWKFDLNEYDRLAPKAYDEKWKKPYQEFIPKNSFIVWSFKKLKGRDEYTYTIQSKKEVAIKAFQLATLKKVLFPRIFYFDKNRDRELNTQYKTAFSNTVNELDWRYRKGLLKEDNRLAINEIFDTLHSEVTKVDDYKNDLLKPVISMLKNDFQIDFNIDDLGFYLFDINQPYKRTVFGHKTENDQIIDIANCGSGVSVLFSLSILISFAQQSKETITILIDEPELHLHADLQKNLFNFLTKSPYHFLVSTHSHLFLDQENCKNNIQFERASNNLISHRRCNQIDLADVQFRLLGNSLTDLYVPENIVLVDGKYDKNIISKALELMGLSKISLQILSCEGTSDIPNKASKFDKVLSEIMSDDKWFNKYIRSNLRILADGDISNDTIEGWKTKYKLNNDQLRHLKLEQKGTEYLFPGSLVKKCVNKKLLKNGTIFSSKSTKEIVDIILMDEKKGINKKDEWQQSPKHRVSKQRLNEFVVKNLNTEILNSRESKGLLNLIEWIKNDNNE